ncbi:hypothetical protein LTR17_027843 [Elasticomyces elasticus]|nr:hypothetical protein LTR17_027843 [Elasticomyces elasticus]
MGSVSSILPEEVPPKPCGIEAVCLGPCDVAALPRTGYNDRDHGLVKLTPLISSDRSPLNSLYTGKAKCIAKRFDQPTSVGGNPWQFGVNLAQTCMVMGAAWNQFVHGVENAEPRLVQRWRSLHFHLALRLLRPEP